MKNISLSLLIKSVLLVLVLAACESQGQYSVNYIFIDVTDKESSHKILDEKQVNQLFEGAGWREGGNLYNGFKARIFRISDLTMNRSDDYEMKMGNNSLFSGQPALARKADVEKFKRSFKQSLRQQVGGMQIGRDNSEIFAILANQLRVLSKESADNKNVILFSDMLEHSNLFSFYKGNVTLAQLQAADKQFPFPNLTGIKIYIVPPIRKENNQQVENALRIWEAFFASKGAEKVQADVNLKMD